MLDKLAKFEVDNFEEEFADDNWYKGKQQKNIDAMEKARKKGALGQFASAPACPLSWQNSHHQRPEKDLHLPQEIHFYT